MSKHIETPVKKGGLYTVDITGLGHSGEGVGRYDGFTIFVPGALEGEKADVKITDLKKNYAVGQITSMKTVSPHRILPACGIYEECGGCQLQHLDYLEQLNIKQTKVIDAVTRIGKLDEKIVRPIIGASSPWEYRNKIQMPVRKLNGKIVAGCFAKGTHQIVPAEKCLIAAPQLNNIISEKIRTAIEKLGISVYDEQTGKGDIRHILGRVGRKTGQVMAVLVTTKYDFANKDKLATVLRESIPNLTSLIQNINPKQTNVIMGDKTITLWGEDTIADKLGEFSFKISAKSFFQVNTEQAEILYNKTLEYAAPTKNDIVIDAYCGTGTITLFLAKHSSMAYGIEIVSEAVCDARRNASDNNIDNARFIVGDTIEVMPKLYQEGVKPDIIVVDPPRAGCGKKVLDTFISINPKSIVYISCNPSSMARDLGELAVNSAGYAVKQIQPVDMFPQTHHVECVALVERK